MVGYVYDRSIKWAVSMYEQAGTKWSTYDDEDFRQFVYVCPKWG